MDVCRLNRAVNECERQPRVMDEEDRGGRVSGDIFFFQAEDGIRDLTVTGVQTCALPICKGTVGSMAQLFHRSANSLARMSILGLLFVLVTLGAVLAELQRSEYVTRQNEEIGRASCRERV